MIVFVVNLWPLGRRNVESWILFFAVPYCEDCSEKACIEKRKLQFLPSI